MDTLNYEHRRAIIKLRCSDHALEIEKGRHKGIKDKSKRICPFCPCPTMEDEEHFILYCNSYNHLREKYDIGHLFLQNLFHDNHVINLAKYTIEAFEYRDQMIRPSEGRGEGERG